MTYLKFVLTSQYLMILVANGGSVTGAQFEVTFLGIFVHVYY